VKPFVVNKHGRLVFPANFLGEPDFTTLHTLDQFTAVIGRDFEAKTPAGSSCCATWASTCSGSTGSR
jgi:3-oxoacyl-[acyl-carrier-protein] synthase III